MGRRRAAWRQVSLRFHQRTRARAAGRVPATVLLRRAQAKRRRERA
jgi:hypothetical protein